MRGGEGGWDTNHVVKGNAIHRVMQCFSFLPFFVAFVSFFFRVEA